MSRITVQPSSPTPESKPASKSGRRKSQLNQDEIRQLKEAFRFFDKNDDGEISPDEIAGVMAKLGLNMSPEELKQIMNDIDENDDGIMDFDEFVVMMDRRMSVGSQKTEIEETFKLFDKKGDGKIDFEELKEVLTQLGKSRFAALIFFSWMG